MLLKQMIMRQKHAILYSVFTRSFFTRLSLVRVMIHEMLTFNESRFPTFKTGFKKVSKLLCDSRGSFLGKKISYLKCST